MRISNSLGVVLAAGSAAVAVGSLVAACSNSSNGGGSATTTDAGMNEDAGSTLYARLGGQAGITTAIGNIVTKELTYPDIASFFAPNLDEPSHKPQPQDIEQCLVALLGSASGGPQTYPTTTTSGFQCRSMTAAHAALHIGNGTFDEFVSVAGGVLTGMGVSAADVSTVAGVLEGTKSSIVDPNAPDGGYCEASACVVPDDGGAEDAASTLYTRLGGHTGITTAVSNIVNKELTYPDIASFFAPNLQDPSHKPQPADIEECLVALLGNAAGGTEVYPTTTSSGFTCRSMTAAHADLGISTGTFNEFVGIAAGVLTGMGVSAADVATVGGVLNGTESSIVTAPSSAPDGGYCIVPACDAGPLDGGQ